LPRVGTLGNRVWWYTGVQGGVIDQVECG